MKSETFHLRTPMPVSADQLWAWHVRSGAFERLNPPFDPVEIEERGTGLAVGSRTVMSAPVGPTSQRWVAVHTAVEPGRMFRDEQESGPFARWVHTHRFEPQPDGTSVLDDEIEYALPLGALGRLFGQDYARDKLARAFAYRHAVTHADLARHAAYTGRPRLNIAVTGASGLIGSALLPFLSTGGHTVRAVKRSGGEIDEGALAGADVVVNLAGAPIAGARWTDERKRLLVASRVDFTRRLIAVLAKDPPRVLLQGSAIGVYGERGDEMLTERSFVGDRATGAAGFLAGLCADWEQSAEEATALGTRVVALRTGLVQSARGGALQKLLVPFRAGGGGPVGNGRAWWSWISLEDVLGAVLHAAMDERVRGPVNLVAPQALTSRDYASTLGRVLHRPAVIPAPAPALRLAFGELADGALLASQRARPAALEASGFSFLHPRLEDALRFTLGR